MDSSSDNNVINFKLNYLKGGDLNESYLWNGKLIFIGDKIQIKYMKGLLMKEWTDDEINE